MIHVVKHLLRDSVIYGIANIIQKLTPIVIIPLIISHLGDKVLKLYDLSFIYVYLFSSLIVLGMDSAASVFYFDRKKGHFNPAQVLNYGFLVQVEVGTVYLLLFYPFRYQVARFLFPYNPGMVHYWIVALTIIPGYMLYNYGLNILLWKRRNIFFLVYYRPY